VSDDYSEATNHIPQAPSHATIQDPESPPYMRLAGKKKLRKLRQTIYEDPGNPFANDEGDEDVSIFTMPFRSGTGQSFHTLHDTTSSNSQPAIASNKTLDRLSPRVFGVRNLLNGSPFEDAVESPAVPPIPRLSNEPNTPIHVPIPKKQGTPTLMKQVQRSMSVAVEPEEAYPEDSPSQYNAFSTHWKSDSRQMHPDEGQGENRRTEYRNTQFYGFYDDILEDYDQGKSSS